MGSRFTHSDPKDKDISRTDTNFDEVFAA